MGTATAQLFEERKKEAGQNFDSTFSKMDGFEKAILKHDTGFTLHICHSHFRDAMHELDSSKSRSVF